MDFLNCVCDYPSPTRYFELVSLLRLIDFARTNGLGSGSWQTLAYHVSSKVDSVHRTISNRTVS